MIVSHASRFVFMHNPKVGGTSVRKVIERFSDSTQRFYFADPDPQSPLHQIDRAHIGIDEFARYYPETFDQCRDYTYFTLWRQPKDRIYSSLQEYSRHFAETDIRFLKPAGRRDFLFQTLDLLHKKGTAEDIMDTFELTHFRPQWIYMTSLTESIEAQKIPLSQIDTLFFQIGALVGEPDLKADTTANASERLALPGGLSGFLANNRRKMFIRSLPGVPFAIRMVRVLLARQPRKSKTSMFELSAEDHSRVDSFLTDFYRRDFEILPITPEQ